MLATSRQSSQFARKRDVSKTRCAEIAGRTPSTWRWRRRAWTFDFAWAGHDSEQVLDAHCVLLTARFGANCRPAAASRSSVPDRRRGRPGVDLKHTRYVFDPVNGTSWGYTVNAHFLHSWLFSKLIARASVIMSDFTVFIQHVYIRKSLALKTLVSAQLAFGRTLI